MSDAVRRVTFVSPAWPPGTHANGIITYVQCLRAGLEELGIECKVATYARMPGGEDAYLIEKQLQYNAATRYARRVAVRVIPRLDTRLGLRRLERQWPFDVLEMEESMGTARWVAKSLSSPVVVRLHGPWCVVGTARGEPRDASFQARVDAEGRAIASAAAVSAPSRDVLARVRRHYGLSLPNAVVIPNPGPVPNPKEMWDGASAEPGLVLFVGRFDRNKGGDLAVDAFALLAERLPSLRLAMAGPDQGMVDESGRRWSFPEYVAANVPEAYRQRIESIGRVTPDELKAWRRRSSVVILASRYENFSMTLLEAMSQGCPIVCPDAGGLPEMVDDDESALLFPAGDASALADRIETLVNSPARAAELGQQALRNYRSRFLPKTVAGRMVEFYGEVCRQKRRL